MSALSDRPSYMQPLRRARPRRWWWKKVRGWPGETCQRCGRMYGGDRRLNACSVWWASNATWAEVVGPHEGGRYCVPCFIHGCTAIGAVAYLTVTLDDFPFIDQHYPTKEETNG